MSQKEFISGIHNYCDRWCERCEFAIKCLVYDESEKIKRRHIARGEDPQSVESALHDVSRSFAKVHRMLARFAKREGLNLEDLARPDQAEPSGGRRRQFDDDKPLIEAADAFMDGCRKLLDQMRPVFDESADSVSRRASFMDVDGETDVLGRVRESFDVLCWDHMLVAVKTRRALSSLGESDVEQDADLRAAHRFDSAGSAAVVLRSLRRSQAALQVIYDWDDSLRDSVIGLLVTAERLIRGLEARIPDSKTFKWPPVFPPDPEEQGGEGQAARDEG